MATMALYGTTIVTTVGWTDAGELMAVAHTFGTAHPTGYPLMTTLARTWSLVPTGLRPLVHLNLLSTILVAASVGLFFLAMARTFRETRKAKNHTPVWPALVAVLSLATSSTFWVQSSSYEVYALHLALLSAIFVCYGAAVSEQKRLMHEMSRWWFAFAYLVGLSFANHMTTILIAPALAWDYARRFGSTRFAWQRIARMVPMMFVGLSIYTVLAVRASSWPPLNWGDPSTWEGFWRHVSGAQYRVWMFSGREVIERQWGMFVESLPTEFMPPWLLLAGWGWIVMWKRWRRAAEFLTLLAATGIVYAINFDIHEIGPYFLVVYVALAFAVTPGLIDVHERLTRWFERGRFIVPFASALLVIWQAAEHHPRIAAANTPAVEKFARNVLEGVDRNAVVFTGRWDYLYSPALYLQHVEGMRGDVLIVDHSLLRDRSWYVNGLRRRAPWLDVALTEEFEAFLRELRKFERGDPFMPAVIQMRWEALLAGIIREAMRERPVYLDMRLAAEMRPAKSRPCGYLMVLSEVPGRALPEWIPVDGNASPYLSDFRDYLATSYAQHAVFAAESGDAQLSDSLAAIARGYAPHHPWLARFPLRSKKLGQ